MFIKNKDRSSMKEALYINFERMFEYDLKKSDLICLKVLYEHALQCEIKLKDANFNPWLVSEVKKLGLVTTLSDDEMAAQTTGNIYFAIATLKRLRCKGLIERTTYGKVEGDFRKSYSFERLILINPAVTGIFYIPDKKK